MRATLIKKEAFNFITQEKQAEIESVIIYS